MVRRLRICLKLPALISALFYLVAWTAHAQPNAQTSGSFLVETWGEKEGLPQSSIVALKQTTDGYLWLGTLNGLVRFDGTRFTVFDEGNTPELNSSRIVQLFEDSRGNLWIGTETAGVALARAKDGKVISIDLGRGRRESRLASACEDDSGAVWLYTADGQLCRFRGERADVWNFGAERYSQYRAVIPSETGGIWVGMNSSLMAISPTSEAEQRELELEHHIPVRMLDAILPSQSGGFWRLADGRVQKWSHGQLQRDWGSYPWDTLTTSVSATREDRQGNLLVGTRGAGVFWFQADGSVARLTTKEGLSHNYILSLEVDREGSIWIGTDGGGLNRVKRPIFETLQPARGSVVQSVSADPQGGLWVGANSGGVGHWKDGNWTSYLSSIPVRAVLVDQQERVWAGTWGSGGLHQFQKDHFQIMPTPSALQYAVLAIHQDRNGTLWFGTPQGLFCWDQTDWKRFATEDGLSANEVRAIADDAEGNLWIGTVGGGLNKFRDGKFTAFRKSDDALPSEDISALYADADGVLWIGTFGSGLARFHGDSWTRFTAREGLVSNGISYLIEDDAGFLWIGSNAGLMRVPKKALNAHAQGAAEPIPWRIYEKPDGLPTRECTQGSQPAACRTPDGRLWFPTIQGVAAVDPSLIKPNPFAPPVVIESVLVEGEPQSGDRLRGPAPETIHVPPRKERLEIHFTALNLSRPDRTRFKYRLEGHESAWTEVGNARVARYSKLPPGQYRFQVTASNEDGVWNEIPRSLDLVIAPPFWRTWWFLTSMGMLLLGSVAGVVHFTSTQRLQRQLEQMRHREALERERARIARDLHDQLGANLTQVALLGELVESDKEIPEEIEAHAQQISRTARDTTRALDEIVWAANPSNDTLEGLINYICKYGQEYLGVAGIRYRWEIPANLPDVPLLPDVRHNVFLAAKEALTNIVRHAQASSAWLRLKLEPQRFTLEIEDNGRGLAGMDPNAAQFRNGLRNMRKRMEDIGGCFSIGSSQEGGAAVRLTAPVNHT